MRHAKDPAACLHYICLEGYGLFIFALFLQTACQIVHGQKRFRITFSESLNHLGQAADVVVTVTNDGWFDDSSIIQHHLRCAQLVAVGCRTPVLSAANNGPTAWIDSQGQVVESLDQGANGWIIATPLRDDRVSLYVRIGDWPARLLGLVCVLLLIDAYRQRRTGLPQTTES